MKIIPILQPQCNFFLPLPFRDRSRKTDPSRAIFGLSIRLIHSKSKERAAEEIKFRKWSISKEH